MSAGEAEAAQRFGQHFRAGAGEQGLQGLVGQRGTHQGADGEDGRTPLPGQQEDTAEQRAGDELGAEIAEPGDHHHHRVQVGVAMLLDQRHQALVEVLEVRPGDGHRQQQDQAQRGRHSGCPAFAPQAGWTTTPTSTARQAATIPASLQKPSGNGRRRAAPVAQPGNR